MNIGNLLLAPQNLLIPNPKIGHPLVHLFRLSELSEINEFLLYTRLNDEEKARADRYRFTRDRYSFMFTRCVLRQLLASCLGTSARDLRITYGHNGKPFLEQFQHLQFNVSHTRGAAAIVLSINANIGIDIELASRENAAFDVAVQMFAPIECVALEQCLEAERHLLFFRLWTLKEAYIKAHGKGFDMALNLFSFRFDPKTSCIDFNSESNDPAEHWQFFSGHVFNDYIWSLATQQLDTAVLQPHVVEYD